ncbi:MAG: hypothetical protein VXX88_03110 [Pseudomonadota bacterium]|nr:hypothetical protein [Pseudomonadota bacterium]
MNRSHEFQSHVTGALNSEVSLEEIRDICMQIAVSDEAPARLDSLRNAMEVIGDDN